ncbi:triosephosphate isomerase [Frondihabitans sucicola]|uniref:Triosephosphate isomerase n=1 Tax=Frondihabitans sucicola TaxID=1268041 RepID=A0ABN6Y2R8_9MICO|nr:triose-phosphate isomerase family protein [Frondihabitans sucicola]BDZ50251.1 triosephosphate isomerase [Frondihabitans sucicola]
MTVIGVSLKMYFGHARTLEWCREIRRLAQDHDAVRSGEARLFVLPTFPSLAGAVEILSPIVAVGAQDLATDDAGAFTGEVSGVELSEIGCSIAEIGHAERRRLFGETPEVVSEKVAAAFRAGLTPLVCVGEEEHGSPEEALAVCLAQLDSALSLAVERGHSGALMVAYEPVWAIGRPAPAPAEHVALVCQGLRDRLGQLADRGGSPVVYGGSAGPGLLTEIDEHVDGLFLGRFAHDPSAVRSILDEVHRLRAS